MKFTPEDFQGAFLGALLKWVESDENIEQAQLILEKIASEIINVKLQEWLDKAPPVDEKLDRIILLLEELYRILRAKLGGTPLEKLGQEEVDYHLSEGKGAYP